MLKRWFEPLRLLRSIHRNTEIILMKTDELVTRLDAVNAKLVKVGTEIQALKDSLANVDLPQAAVDALARVEATAQADDDANPDAPAPTT